MPSREAVLGFLFGVAVLAFGAGFLFDLPTAVRTTIYSALFFLIFGGWIFFSIRDRRKKRST